MKKSWKPPFSLFVAGRQQTGSKAYYNDARDTPMPRRILVKHTLSGEGVLYAYGRRLVLKPGTVFVIERPGPYQYCYEEDGELWKFEFFSIAVNSFEDILPPFLRQNPVMELGGSPELYKQIQDLIDIRLRKNYQPSLAHSLSAYAFLINYIELRTHGKSNVPTAVRELLKILDSDYLSGRQFSIGESCRKLGYTPEALIRLFKQYNGVTPGRYLRNRRLTKACRLLSGSHLNIKQIAYECGFESQNYLGRIFKQVLGITPKQYRNNPDLLLLEKLDLNMHKVQS